VSQQLQRSASIIEEERRHERKEVRIGEAAHRFGDEPAQRRAKKRRAEAGIEHKDVKAALCQSLGGETASGARADYNRIESSQLLRRVLVNCISQIRWHRLQIRQEKASSSTTKLSNSDYIVSYRNNEPVFLSW